jgi:hypothetical protein
MPSITTPTTCKLPGGPEKAERPKATKAMLHVAAHAAGEEVEQATAPHRLYRALGGDEVQSFVAKRRPRQGGMHRQLSTKAPTSSSDRAVPQAERRWAGTRSMEDGRTSSLQDFDVSRESSHYPFETSLWMSRSDAGQQTFVRPAPRQALTSQ